MNPRQLKKPLPPPPFSTLLDEYARKGTSDEMGAGLLDLLLRELPEDRKYLNWDNLRHREPPAGLSHRDWWLLIRIQRERGRRTLPLTDGNGGAFYLNPSSSPIPEFLNRLDMNCGGSVGTPDQFPDPETRNRYLISTLMEEGVMSSMLEGAASTRREATDMLRSGRQPASPAERMILNNYLAMRRLGRHKDRPLTPDLLREIHTDITRDALNNPRDVGRFRDPADPNDGEITVQDELGQVLHKPPAITPERITALCDFANGRTPDFFIHPIVRSVILHFQLAYDHPFADGNGRTARALFYWSMLRHGYWLTEYLSISAILLKAPAQYARSFLHTETDENDIGHFLVYQLRVLERAVGELHEFIRRKTRETERLDSMLRDFTLFNHRQKALLAHALRHPDARYTFKSHQTSHGIVYQTARTDLIDLLNAGLLVGRKLGKTRYFTPARSLDTLIRDLGET